jgi:hypothetical protein
MRGQYMVWLHDLRIAFGWLRGEVSPAYIASSPVVSSKIDLDADITAAMHAHDPSRRHLFAANSKQCLPIISIIYHPKAIDNCVSEQR